MQDCKSEASLSPEDVGGSADSTDSHISQAELGDLVSADSKNGSSSNCIDQHIPMANRPFSDFQCDSLISSIHASVSKLAKFHHKRLLRYR